MKKAILTLLLLPSLIALGQTFEIEAPTHPFYNVLEWKGMGALMMSKDPNSNTKQITLTLIGDQNTSIWDQKFNPKGEDFYYIASENARYVYFLDNLELETGKVFFSQLNSAGNIKSTSVSIGTAVKSLGYSTTDLELVNVVVTDKSLVHHFRYVDKKNKEIVEIATFITHHNFRCYAAELGRVPFDNLKDEDFGHWRYIGFTGEKIYFAVREKTGKQKGWTVKEFSSKGEPVSSIFITAPDGLIPVQNIGFGTTGSYYLDKSDGETEKGLLTQINGKYYLVGGRSEANSAELVLFELVEGEWKELNTMQLNYFIEKKALNLGIYPMTEGIGYHLDHNGYDKVSMLYFEPKKTTAHNDFTDLTIYNPSSVFVKKEKKEFVVMLENKVLFFDTEQLGKEGPVKFEIKKK